MAHTQDASKYFPHERLVAYQLARAAVQLVNALRSRLRALPGKAGEQLERAVVGAHTNLCAGACAMGAEARRHFRIALTEAAEAGGCTDLAFDLCALGVHEH